MTNFYLNPKSTLFIGRFQPFHEGHKTLIQTILKRGKPIVIAIRDTEISQANPYTLYERWTMIQKELKEFGELVKIVVIPDIDEICYGRNVGYAIRQIQLDNKVEQISGTKIREKSPPAKPIIWLTGQSGSGKSTIATGVNNEIGGIVLDGDEMRKSISIGLGFSKEDREEHNLRVARLAKILSKRSIVIVSVIAPFESTRQKVDSLIKPIWIYIKRTILPDPQKPYEEPINPNLILNSDTQTPKQQVSQILKLLNKLNLYPPTSQYVSL